MAEPTEIEALQRQIAELQVQLAAAQAGGNATPRTDTGGGAVVEGAVRTSGGHFIGRDFIQTVTQVVQAGEDEEEAKSVIKSLQYLPGHSDLSMTIEYVHPEMPQLRLQQLKLKI